MAIIYRDTDKDGNHWIYVDDDDYRPPILPIYLTVKCAVCQRPYTDREFYRWQFGDIAYMTPDKKTPFCSAQCGEVYSRKNQ